MSDWSFAENEEAQALRWAQLSYAQRLQWLWDAKMFARRAIAAANMRTKASESEVDEPREAAHSSDARQ
jgi:hypothetical protein